MVAQKNEHSLGNGDVQEAKLLEFRTPNPLKCLI